MTALRQSMADSVVAIDLVRLSRVQAGIFHEWLPLLLQSSSESMQEPPVKLLLLMQEWRPDRGQGKASRVALLQLASSSVAVLVRTCLLGWQLPPCVQGFLR